MSSELDGPGQRELARFDDPDEEALRQAVERFRRATEHGSACSEAAVQAHAEACAARVAWFPRLADRIADAVRNHEEQRGAFAILAGPGGRNAAIVDAAEALEHARKREDALRRLWDDALRAESTRASMIEAARGVEAAVRGREWHRGDSAALPPPDDWRDVG